MKRTKSWRLTAVGMLAATGAVSLAHASATVTPLADTSSASASALVNTLLSTSSALTVVTGSAQYTGAASASGTFANGGTGANGLGIDAGVVLTSGDARFISSSAAFAGDSANKSGDFTAGAGNSLTPNTSPGNALFSTLTPVTFNASILSFQFVPTYGTLTLSLVFGSEDYNDLVNVNGYPTDVMGVFINGANQALVPGTSLAISASTINCGGPTSGAATGVGAQNCALYRDNPPFSDAIDSEVDGFTVVLTFSMAVNAGQVNSISIGIADAGDTFGDSALLLAAGSVASVPEPSTWALMVAGIAAVGAVVRRRRA